MTLEFGKEKTAIIKGLAIIFMIILHCSIPGNWDISFMEFGSENWVRFMGYFYFYGGIWICFFKEQGSEVWFNTYS